ncbi:hypothetical protein ACJX0J_030688 [Zea mays]
MVTSVKICFTLLCDHELVDTAWYLNEYPLTTYYILLTHSSCSDVWKSKMLPSDFLIFCTSALMLQGMVLFAILLIILYKKGVENGAVDALSRRPHDNFSLYVISCSSPEWLSENLD